MRAVRAEQRGRIVRHGEPTGNLGRAGQHDVAAANGIERRLQLGRLVRSVVPDPELRRIDPILGDLNKRSRDRIRTGDEARLGRDLLVDPLRGVNSRRRGRARLGLGLRDGRREIGGVGFRVQRGLERS